MSNLNSIQDETKIQKAIMDTFFTFDLFDNTSGDLDKKYFDMIKKLANSDLLINSFNEEKGVSFQEKFDNELERRRLLYEQGDAPSRIREDFITSAGDNFVFNGFENFPNITQKDKIIDLLEFSQERALHQYVRMLENEEKYTGTNILDIKNVFLLFPIKIKTLSDEIIYIDVYFTLFKHGYAILDTSFRINDEKIEQLGTNIWDVEIKAAYLPNFMVAPEKTEKYLYKKIGRCNTVDIATDRYIDVLKKLLNVKSEYMFKYESLTILKMDKQPHNFDNENISLYKKIFKLLFAPTNLSISSKKAKERLEKHSKLPDRNSKIFLNSKRFILVYGTDVYKVLSDYPEEIQIESLYSTFRADMIFALEKLFLKTISSYKYLVQFSNPNISLNKMYSILSNRDMELRYETNQLYYNYSTTREYIDFFLEKGLEKSIIDAIEDTVERVKNLISLRREIRLNQITVTGTILALIFTVLFSISGIKETLNILGIFDITTVISTYKYLLLITFMIIILLYKDILIVSPLRKIRSYLFYIRLTLPRFWNLIKSKIKEEK